MFDGRVLIVIRQDIFQDKDTHRRRVRVRPTVFALPGLLKAAVPPTKRTIIAFYYVVVNHVPRPPATTLTPSAYDILTLNILGGQDPAKAK